MKSIADPLRKPGFDWHRSTQEIVEETGITSTRVSQERRLHAPETLNKYNKGRSLAGLKRLQGTGGLGRFHRGRPDHIASGYWVIKDPQGNVYEFRNLYEWIRQNKSMFLPYDTRTPFSKIPLERKVGTALSANGHWFGWTVITKGP